MRHFSRKRSARNAAVKPFRTALLAQFPACMVCGAHPKKPHRVPPDCSELSVHEIFRGAGRVICLDKPFGCLVLCWLHNSEMTDRKQWPEPRQLAVLKRAAPENYDLVAYNAMVNANAPNRITPAEVDAWLPFPA